MSPLARAVIAGALVLTLDASIQEFADIIALSDTARRERFHLPPECVPVVGAVRPAGPSAGRLTVFVGCSDPATPPLSEITPASWRDK